MSNGGPFHTTIEPALIEAAGLAALQEALNHPDLALLNPAHRGDLRRRFLLALQRRTDPLRCPANQTSASPCFTPSTSARG